MVWFHYPQVKMNVLIKITIKSGFVSFKYAFAVFMFPITSGKALLNYKKPAMKIHFRNT